MQNTIAEKIVKEIKKRTDIKPEIAMILGSGWGKVTETLTDKIIIPYSELEDMPLCTVKGHSGNFVIGKIKQKSVIIMQGRFHLYEGKSINEVVLPLIIMKKLGAEKLILTNSAGGINLTYNVGDIMLIKDHINFTGINPLIGIKPTEEYPVFVDMNNCYNSSFIDIAENVCGRNNISVHKGVYMGLTGPNYETPAEIVAYRNLGADAVGMSTVTECIFARYLKLKVLGISCITNKAAGIEQKELNHMEVLEITRQNENNFKKLITEITEKL